jgi:hypothetical protein
MRCLYYLAPTLETTTHISEQLHEIGVDDWFIHVVSRDEAGLKREQIHSSNYLETLDLLRSGLLGANIGFIIGVIAAALVMLFEPFGPNVPNFVYLLILVFFTLFGSWEGGLYGVATENKKLERFKDELREGQYLILIYAPKGKGEAIKQMVKEKYPNARHVATDRHFINPFSVVRRRRRRRDDAAATS